MMTAVRRDDHVVFPQAQRASVFDCHQYVGHLQASLFIYRRISTTKFFSQLV